MWRYKKTALSINVERTFTTDIKNESGSSYFNFLSINFPSNFMQCQISLSKVLILFCDWFKRKCRLTSTTDNCCQRAKVHRLVAQPGLFAKCHDHVALYILGTCVIFMRLLHSALSKYPKCESALHYFSKCKSALHYFSKCKSALHYFSECESAPHYFSKCESPTFKNRFQGANSARLCCLAGRYDNHSYSVPAPIDCLKIPFPVQGYRWLIRYSAILLYSCLQATFEPRNL